MQITKTKYLTYFFRQNYNLNQEKNTFSAFVPEGKKGFWILTEDSEKKENISKIAVTSVTEAYFSNDIVSEDNMINFLNIANKKIIESKIRKNMDYKNRFSTSIVIAEDDKIIVGNIGSSKIKVFRNNELIEEVEGDTVVGLNLKKYDYILLGTSEFWSILNENKILEMFKKNSSHLGFESELSEKVKNIEIERKIANSDLKLKNLEKQAEGTYKIPQYEFPISDTEKEIQNLNNQKYNNFQFSKDLKKEIKSQIRDTTVEKIITSETSDWTTYRSQIEYSKQPFLTDIEIKGVK